MIEKQSNPDKEYASPTGAYALRVKHVPAESGWANTIGSVYRKGDSEPIFVVERNIGQFPYCFVEVHPNGHDYLVCGSDYQGQTILELDTGKRVDYLPEGKKHGVGFCWGEYEASTEKDVIAVTGCYWAGPNEVGFVDFSDPMNPPFLIISEFPDEEGAEFVHSPWSSSGIVKLIRFNEETREKYEFDWKMPTAAEVARYWQERLNFMDASSLFYADAKIQLRLAKAKLLASI